MGGQVAKVAEMLGHPLMPWQRLVADVGLEIDPATGLPAYRYVWFTVMRQSGKTTLAFPWQLHRCISPVWDGPQRVAYTAQTGFEAQKKLLEDQLPVLEKSPLARLVTKAGGGRVRRAGGQWGLDFGTGSRIDVLGSTTSSGHGQTLDLGVIDEAWKDEDDRREQSMEPAMLTRRSAQLLGYSTAGTERSTYLLRKVEEGRAAAQMDRGSGMAYFEWSIPEDADIGDEDVWWQFMPALGWTISLEAVRSAYQSMSEQEFRRAMGNQPTMASDRLIPSDTWDAVQDPDCVPSGSLTWGVDVLRQIDGQADAAAIVVADGDRRVALVEHRYGTSWVADRVAELVRERGGAVVVDGGGPAGPVADDIERAGVRVERLKSGEVVAACGRAYDWIADGRCRVRPHPVLDDAVAGAAKKTVGDRFVWSRHASGADVTPLMALTLAMSATSSPSPFVFTS